MFSPSSDFGKRRKYYGRVIQVGVNEHKVRTSAYPVARRTFLKEHKRRESIHRQSQCKFGVFRCRSLKVPVTLSISGQPSLPLAFQITIGYTNGLISVWCIDMPACLQSVWTMLAQRLIPEIISLSPCSAQVYGFFHSKCAH